MRIQLPAETVGERLRRLREERGLSQRDLSEPGVSYAYISRIEAGARQPSVKALRLLARKLGVSADYLETGIELGASERRELEIADAELALRLGENTSAARAELARLRAEADAAGDLPAATRARIGLGLAEAQQGALAEAVSHLEQVLASGLVDPLTRPDVYAALGRAYAAQGEQAKAAQLWEECVQRVAAEAPEDEASRTRFATYLSYALADLGEFSRAQEVLREALAAGSDLTDAYTQVRLYWALARLLAMQGQARAALAHAQRAVALLEATEDTLQLGRAHLLCGGILVLEGKAGEALPHLAAAEQAFSRRTDANDLASLRAEQAKAALQLGDPATAVARAREALELLAEGDPVERGAMLLVLGEALAQEDDEAAEEALRGAVDLFAEHERWPAAASAARKLGRFLRAADRERDALEAFEAGADFAERS